MPLRFTLPVLPLAFLHRSPRRPSRALRKPHSRGAPRVAVAAVFVAFTFSACSIGVLGCAHAPAAGALSDERFDRILAIQSKNPDFSLTYAPPSSIVATSRSSSLFRDDLRPELDQFLASSGRAAVPPGAVLRRVTDEPDHVRLMASKGGHVVGTIDARLVQGAIVIELREDG